MRNVLRKCCSELFQEMPEMRGVYDAVHSIQIWVRVYFLDLLLMWTLRECW